MEKRKGELLFHQSVGGVATGMTSVAESRDCLWLGWADLPSARVTAAERETVEKRLLDEFNSWPVFLTQRDVSGFYYGFSNRTLWPLFHTFARYAEFDAANWRAYERANRAFRDAVLEVARPGDTIWVHDYQLMLLPALLREELPDSAIGFFLHIPFPSFEIFRMLPWRRQLLEGVLGADLVGFHTFDYARHFLSSTRSLLGIDDRFGKLEVDERQVSVDAFPMGIDVERFAGAVQGKAVQRHARRVRPHDAEHRIVLSVDRLDYTKGIPERLEAFDDFLERHPGWRGRVRMVCVAVPSRTRVERYLRLKEQVDQLVGSINGRWGTVDWTPVTYLYRMLPFQTLVGMYAAADVALVTPLRDGMNLVAKEYVACRTDGTGVLVLSEMAGAARELGEAVLVNPHDRDAMVEALEAALEMPEKEQIERNRAMQARLERYDVKRWAGDFLHALDNVKLMQVAYAEHALTQQQRERLLAAARSAPERTIVLDYDGTLVPFARKPGGAVPDDHLLDLLRRLSGAPSTTLVIISGRERGSLDEWLGDVGAVLIAEHGAWIREPQGDWQTSAPMSGAWKKEIRPVLERYVDRTPGSFIEEKDFSLAWHYRLVQADQAAVRVTDLTETLAGMTEGMGIAILEGNRVVEVKNAEVDKGRAAHRWMTGGGNAFLLAAGDDRTDEALFEAAPDTAWTIKVGRGRSRARASLPWWRDMRELLEEIAEVIG